MAKEKLFLSHKNMPEDRVEDEMFKGFYVYNPHIVFYVYTPVAILNIGLAIYMGVLWWQIALGLMVAVAFWTVFEYSMHRYLFHFESENPFWKKFFYTIHHGHHDYPNDNRFMLVHPIISLVAFVILWGLFYLIAGHYAHAFMGGIGICYMFYDWLHFASHNYNYKNKYFQMLKVHHMRHHYEDNDKNFAFTTLIWDIIMKTLLRN